MHLFVKGNVFFGTCYPYYHHAVASVLCFETANVFAYLIGEIPSALAALYIGAVDVGSVALVEEGGYGAYCFKLLAYGLNVGGLQYSGLYGCLVSVVGE